MRRPHCSGNTFLADVKKHQNDTDDFNVWWLGQSGFLIQWLGKHLLMDPYLSESLTKKYAETDKPHVRMTKRVIDPLQLDFIDVVTASHSHTDHLDPETLQPLVQSNINLDLVVPAAVVDIAMERSNLPKDRLSLMNAGDTVESNGFLIHAIPSAHEEVETDENDDHYYLGYIVRFGPWTVYHSGDTIEYDEMEDTLAQCNLDLMFLPINGRKPERRVAGNMWGNESAWLAKRVKARSVIPHHYNMFEFNTENPDEFIAEAEQINQPYHVLENGERWCSSQLE